MNIKETLLLQQVKRYPISYTNREQSVAEHSYNVLLIALWLIEEEMDRDLEAEVVQYAVHHDIDEIETGDIPSPFKRRLRAECPAVIKLLDGEHYVTPEVKAIVKLADCLEAIYYAREFGGSRYTTGKIYPDIVANFHHCANTGGMRDSVRLRAIHLEKDL